MTDAFNTLREMLDGVPDDAQVYVEEREIVTEWPGITAGTFRQLLAEIAGFEAMWEQREKAHDAALAEVTKERDIWHDNAMHEKRHAERAKIALATAKRELDAFEPTDLTPMIVAAKREGHRAGWDDASSSLTSMSQVYEMNRRYPAIDPPSGEGTDK
jgi:hypothetical protein